MMKTLHLFVVFALVVLVIPLVRADTYRESSTVSRIVGNSPDEVIAQLTNTPISIESSSISANGEDYAESWYHKVDRVLQQDTNSEVVHPVNSVDGFLSALSDGADLQILRIDAGKSVKITVQ